MPYPPLCPVIRGVGQNLSFSDRGSSWGSSSQDRMALGSFAQPTLGPDSPSVESPSMPRRGPGVEAGEMSPTPQAASLTPQGGAGWAARKRSEDITRVPASYQSRIVRLCVGVCEAQEDRGEYTVLLAPVTRALLPCIWVCGVLCVCTAADLHQVPTGQQV